MRRPFSPLGNPVPSLADYRTDDTMSWIDVAVVVGGAVFIAVLLRAGHVISQNPHTRLKLFEELIGGRLPDSLTFEEKQLLLDRRGISRRNTIRSIFIVMAVALSAILVFWLGQDAL